MSQPSLLDMLPGGAGGCATCGAPRPENFDRALWLEPVSGECFECNHRTVRDLLYGTAEEREAALVRHYRNMNTGRRRKRAAR